MKGESMPAMQEAPRPVPTGKIDGRFPNPFSFSKGSAIRVGLATMATAFGIGAADCAPPPTLAPNEPGRPAATEPAATPTPDFPYRVDIPIVGAVPTITGAEAKPTTTLTVEPKPTPVGIGPTFRDLGETRANDIEKILLGTDEAKKAGLSNDDITHFNDVVAKTSQATATAEAKSQTPAETKPAPVAPVEAKKEQPCNILPSEYCSQGQLVALDIKDKPYTYVGFNFPATDKNDQKVSVPVFAPVSGHLLLGTEGGQPFVGSFARIRTDTEAFAFDGNIDTSKFGNIVDVPHVDAGTVIGYTGTTDKKSLGYDLLFTISHASPTGPETSIDKLKGL